MRRCHWLLGLGASFLIACGVTTEPAPTPETSTVEASLAVQATSAATPAAACTPGDDEPCCPFSQGCSCLGDRFCRANGHWSGCMGAGAAGEPCP